MPYIGNSPGTGVRSRFIYTATASQTTFSGADNNSKTLKYADSAYVDVFLNGVCLVPGTDYTASTKTSIVLTQAASLNDTLEVVAYDIATISDTVSKADGGTFEDAVTVSGKLTVQNQVQAVDITNSTGNLNMNFTPNDSTGIAQVNFGPSTDKDKARIRYEVANDDLKLITNNTDRITIDTDGHVGIGTTPKSDAELITSGGHGIDIESTALPRLRFYNGSTFKGGIEAIQTAGSMVAGSAVNDFGIRSQDDLLFATGGSSERMRIASGGELFVGGFSSSLGGGNHKLQIYTDNGSGDSGIIIKHRDATGVSSVTAQYFLNNSGGTAGSITMTSSSVAYNTSSDHRLKENLSDISDGITRVKQLQPKRFNWIADESNTAIDGFLAHEAQAVVPEAVTGTHNEVDDDDNPVYQGIDQSKLVPLLTAALKEAITKIETLETKVAALEAG